MRGENWSTWGKTSQNRVENQQTQSTYDGRSGNGTWAILVEGRCSHHCTNPALKEFLCNVSWKIATFWQECWNLYKGLDKAQIKLTIADTVIWLKWSLLLRFSWISCFKPCSCEVKVHHKNVYAIIILIMPCLLNITRIVYSESNTSFTYKGISISFSIGSVCF